MSDEPLLPMLHELASCQHAIERHSARHVRTLGLTPAQFDVVAILGSRDDVTLRELSERTLITKGTLTGVVDRLERRGIVRRRADPADGRRTFVELTSSGRRLFARVFPEHLAYVRRAFARLAPSRLERMRRDLASLRDVVDNRRRPR
jgi:DNA-binding MarR family transcriptional regulator